MLINIIDGWKPLRVNGMSCNLLGQGPEDMSHPGPSEWVSLHMKGDQPYSSRGNNEPGPGPTVRLLLC